MTWEIALSSSLASTFLDIVLDVFAIWLIDAALIRIAVFLNACELYDEHNTIQISDVWFVGLTGRSHGPMWFRKTQVAVKVLLLVWSISIGLSNNPTQYNVLGAGPGQIVLVRQERRMAQLGIGISPRAGEAQTYFTRCFVCASCPQMCIDNIECLFRRNYANPPERNSRSE